MAAKTYYSENAGLMCPVKPFRCDPVTDKPVEPQFVHFTRMGQDRFGSLTTSDPEIQAALDKRIVEVGDIFGPDEFARRSIPAEKRVEMMARELEQTNRLLADLQAKQAPQGQKPEQQATARISTTKTAGSFPV